MLYRRTQTAPAMYVITVVGALCFVMWAIADDGAGLGVWFAVLGLLLIAVGLVAARLTVVVDDTSVTSAYGWGWPRRRIDLHEIDEVAAVRNSWWHGWGIHKVSGGWIFNNAGRDAVELRLRSGKVFRMGTDQPAELLAALDRAHTA